MNNNMIRLIPQDEMIATSQWKPIVKSYKYEMKPTKKQEVLLNQTLSTCRHLYNDSLAGKMVVGMFSTMINRII